MSTRAAILVAVSWSLVASCIGGPGAPDGDHCTYPGAPGDCDADAYCNRDGYCHPRPVLGESCALGEQCAVGLVCGPFALCAAPGDDGAPCRDDGQCAGGRLCNHGYVPEDATLGECHPASGVGAPCGWGGANDDPENPDVLFAHGCDPGLVCVPPVPALPTTTTLDPASSGCSGLQTSCGYPGTCQAAGSVADGGGCLDASACQSGRCVHVPAPHGADSSPLFGLAGSEFVGAWPDRCAGPSDLVDNDQCASAPTSCAPGLYCDRSTAVPRCQAWMQSPRGARCGIYDQPSLGSDDECRLGLRCTPSTAGMFCREPGSDLENESCSEASCAPGLGCRASDSTCVPLGDVGASCAAGEQPCRLGLLCDATGHCAPAT